MRSAVTIDTRPYEVDYVAEHLKWLSGDWQLVFFGSCFNEQRIKELYPDCLFIEVTPNFNFDWLNSYMLSSEFWNAIPDEEILIFQYDSGILKKGIEKFFEWDYAGACWNYPKFGGNGGISIRKKSVMLECINPMRESGYIGHEDGYFCDIMHREGIGRMAPREVCMEFGTETIFTLGTYTWHKINGYMPLDKCELIWNQYK